MKLATFKDGSRDGALIIVDKELRRAVMVPDIAKTMQSALDNWAELVQPLMDISKTLNENRCDRAFDLNIKQLASPLPRAYQWADASAYVNHVELVRKSRGIEMPEDFWSDPLMYQGGSDAFLSPTDPILASDESFGVDYEAEVAIIVDDVPMGSSIKECQHKILLIMLVNDVSLRNLALKELQKGFGFFQCKPSSAFTPVAITPDELGDAWDGGRVHLPIYSYVNDQLFGSPNAGKDMTFDFPTLIAHAAHTRPLTAGTIIGSGTVSNADRKSGSSCIIEKRMLEKLHDGEPKTPFLHFGDRVKIEMLDKNQHSIFGAIDQVVEKL